MSGEGSGSQVDPRAKRSASWPSLRPSLRPWRPATPRATLAGGPAAETPAAASPDASPKATRDGVPAPDGERWEVSGQWRAAWRAAKWGVAGVSAVIALTIAGQVFLFFDMFRSVHPALGYAFVALAAGLVGRFLVWPAYRFASGPGTLKPPQVDLSAPDASHEDVLARIDYDDLYLMRLLSNPEAADKRDAIVGARAELAAIRAGLDGAGVAGVAARIAVFEKKVVGDLLRDLDARVDAYIRKEAVAVGVSTSISLNGNIDAFLVLWRNVNMVARIARLYGGRPDFRVTLMILRDVSLAVILARVLDDVSEMAGEALGGVVGKLGGVVVGPFLDGSLNALMTLKLGELAKRRCRSFEPWSDAAARSATKAAFDRVSKEASGLVGDIVKASGVGVGKVAGVAVGAVNYAAEIAKAAPRSAWGLVQGVVGRGGQAEPR